MLAHHGRAQVDMEEVGDLHKLDVSVFAGLGTTWSKNKEMKEEKQEETSTNLVFCWTTPHLTGSGTTAA